VQYIDFGNLGTVFSINVITRLFHNTEI